MTQQPHDSSTHQLPNSLREYLLQHDLGESALVLDACLTSGLERGVLVTAADLIELLPDISPGLIRRALSSGLFPVSTIHKSKRGRPQLQYTIPDIDKLTEKYAPDTPRHSDRLHPSDLTSLRMYRIGLHREFIRRNQDRRFSRIFLGRRLGVSKSATRHYDKDQSIQVTHHYERHEINYYVNALDLVPSERKDWSTWLEIQPRDEPAFRAPPKRHIAANWLERGAWITVVRPAYQQLC